jgi:phage N-6-adenine-methyltransferase
MSKTRTSTVHFSSASQEWSTPPQIIVRVIAVLGEIDLDPCASRDPVNRLPAHEHFTANDDGLRRSWRGRVYMNPPYGRWIRFWISKLIDEYRSGRVTTAITLVPARTDTSWWRLLAEYPVCFVRGRLRFSGHENSAPFPSAVIYLGRDVQAFAKSFGDLGTISCRLPCSEEVTGGSQRG